MHESLILLIAESLRRVADERGLGLPGVLQGDTPLFGESGILDSLALVALIVLCEQSVEDNLGITISLADERALSQRRSPFATIGSMAEYVSSRLEADGGNG
jgi:acyl carrier protein